MRLSHAVIGTTFAALLLAGCATTSSIAPQYVSPDKYSSKSCDELSYEINRVSQLAAAKEKEQSGLSATGVGIGIAGGRHGIYPTISFGVGKSNSANNKKMPYLPYMANMTPWCSPRAKKTALMRTT